MSEKVLIIAEAGVNHNGDMSIAKKLIDEAVYCGVDIIKFQTFRADSIVTKSAQKADYQKESSGTSESQYMMLKKLELSNTDFIELKKYCESKSVEFLSTGFDFESLEFLKTLNMNVWKIPSGEITNLPYLEFIGKLNKKVILSTGMSTIEEINDAVKVLVKSGTERSKISILHCTTEYPAPFNDVNLKAMHAIAKTFKLEVGYSDHTEGIEVPVAAVALGARIIEKHFTLDKSMPGPDHKASITPAELKSMVSSIRNVELALGREEKMVVESEKKNILIARKSIVAKKDIKKGEKFTTDNITVKRPGSGISPMKWYEVLGQSALKDYKEDELI